jgi:hypothetical protein
LSEESFENSAAAFMFFVRSMLQRDLLEEYSNCDSSASVVKAQNAYIQKCEAEQQLKHTISNQNQRSVGDYEEQDLFKNPNHSDPVLNEDDDEEEEEEKEGKEEDDDDEAEHDEEQKKEEKNFDDNDDDDDDDDRQQDERSQSYSVNEKNIRPRNPKLHSKLEARKARQQQKNNRNPPSVPLKSFSN